jgi:hypothetical protein
LEWIIPDGASVSGGAIFERRPRRRMRGLDRIDSWPGGSILSKEWSAALIFSGTLPASTTACSPWMNASLSGWSDKAVPMERLLPIDHLVI